jgi:hypothetical protein
MDTRRSTNWLNQRLLQWEHSLAFFFEKPVHKKRFKVILVAVLVLGLILVFIFAQTPIAGETSPIAGYP